MGNFSEQVWGLSGERHHQTLVAHSGPSGVELVRESRPDVVILDLGLPGLDGIEVGQTIVVLFWLDRASRDVLKVYPRGDRSRGLRGVFATRSPVRPNPIAISHLEVLGVHDNRIEVRGLDILDGTPVIDIKKELGPDQDRTAAN